MKRNFEPSMLSLLMQLYSLREVLGTTLPERAKDTGRRMERTEDRILQARRERSHKWLDMGAESKDTRRRNAETATCGDRTRASRPRQML
jgi:hypothetical protein